jgi:hypothetical protein
MKTIKNLIFIADYSGDINAVPDYTTVPGYDRSGRQQYIVTDPKLLCEYNKIIQTTAATWAGDGIEAFEVNAENESQRYIIYLHD